MEQVCRVWWPGRCQSVDDGGKGVWGCRPKSRRVKALRTRNRRQIG